MAQEFDRMTATMVGSADTIRRAAEDNAHAFKTPIAIMRQSLEPLRRIVPTESTRGSRARSTCWRNRSTDWTVWLPRPGISTRPLPS